MKIYSTPHNAPLFINAAKQLWQKLCHWHWSGVCGAREEELANWKTLKNVSLPKKIAEVTKEISVIKAKIESLKT